MPDLRVINLDRRNPESTFLQRHRRDINSQFGEDGIIERIFEIVPPANRWCVEFGAWDGIYLSNTCHLVRDLGWDGVFIECSEQKFEELEETYAGYDNAHLINALVGFQHGVDSLDFRLRDTKCPLDVDLVCIDIDGNDYHVWRNLVRFRPRLVIVEFNPTIPNDVIFAQDADMSINQGASLAAFIELGKRKGYELVATTNCNAFFVLEELYDAFGIDDNSIDAMHVNVTGRIFQGYDGTLCNDMRPLQWAGRGGPRPTMDQFQLLPPEERGFRDHVHETPKWPTTPTAPGAPGRLVLFGGQSNMLGHRLATEGDKPISPLVFAWDNGGAEGRWRVAELGRPPFNPAGEAANNLALHFAVNLADKTGEAVYLVGHAVNGSSILTWRGEASDNLGQLISEVDHALASKALHAAGITRASTMLWHQGESDDEEAWMVPERLTTLADYRDAFEHLRSVLAEQPWWAEETRFIAGELVRDGWLSARNDFYSAGALGGRYDAVVSSEGLGHTGDAAHFDGRALQTLGERMFDAWVELDRVS